MNDLDLATAETAAKIADLLSQLLVLLGKALDESDVNVQSPIVHEEGGVDLAVHLERLSLDLAEIGLAGIVRARPGYGAAGLLLAGRRLKLRIGQKAVIELHLRSVDANEAGAA